VFAACTAGPPSTTGATARRDQNRIVVGSFDFAESRQLAAVYGEALRRAGMRVQFAFDLGPREFVAPAVARGLVDLVPEYAGTALQFLSRSTGAAASDVSATHDALVEAARRVDVSALAAAPAQDANAFVVTRGTSARYGLRNLSDLVAVAPKLEFGGSPECRERPLCLQGLKRVYGATFREVVALDVGGPLTRQALETGDIDVGLLFTTDPALAGSKLVALRDDRHLQPAENVTPLVRDSVVRRFGARLVEALDSVSRRLTTEKLRALNARAASDAGSARRVAVDWLTGEGIE
jgi:osmoprotectant transport system substrate-binding protein